MLKENRLCICYVDIGKDFERIPRINVEMGNEAERNTSYCLNQ